MQLQTGVRHRCGQIAGGQKRQQPVMNVPVHEHIIRRDAGLAAVEQLAERQTARGDAQIRSFIDDAGAFAAQFQRDGGEGFARGAHDLAADGHAAGEEDVIKPLMQQRLILRAPPSTSATYSGGKHAATICAMTFDVAGA